MDPTDHSQPSQGAQAPQGDLYQQKQRPSRSHRERTRRLDSGPTVGGAPRHTSINPMKQTLIANTRKFVFFAVGMVVLLFLSIKALTIVWQAKDRAMTGTQPAAPAKSVLPSNPAPRAQDKPSKQENVESAENAQGDGLKIESMKKAAYLARLGKSLEQSSQYEEAIARYKEALDLWPYLNQVWGQLGRLYLQIKDYDRAEIALSKAVENNPGSAEPLNDLGVTYLYQGKVDKAIKLFETATEIDVNYPPGFFNVALCHLAKKDRNGARTALERYLKLKPSDARALREMAFLDASGGNYPVAMKTLEKALSEAPDWPLLYFDAAATSALLGRADGAIKYLEKVEPLTSPAAVYRIYQEPAFREVRLTEIGKLFEKELAERARDLLASVDNSKQVKTFSEPIPSEIGKP
jgi:Flp pilus assembly protein TadD